MATPEQLSIDITRDEITDVSSYIKSKNTAVLTVMFTDIKGFVHLTETEGEDRANEIRIKHDEILKGIIERDNDGLIVKYIGDAIMAIFSEPSAAVDRALNIQQEIRQFNKDNTEFTDISVRIGLHMGQVSVEDNVQADVFGRHVNRAARIESLTDGGQIFLTYPVFDSAKGWLGKLKDVKWHLHGKYALKGITDPVEIYEVYDEKLTKPAPPKKGNKVTQVPKGAFAAGLVILGFLLAYFMTYIKRTETWFMDFYPQQVVVNHQELLELDGVQGDKVRKVKTDLSQGKHLLYYDVADNLRFYSQIEVEYGENKLNPKFTEHRLPAVTNRLMVKSTGGGTEQKQVEKPYEYSLYDATSNKVAYQSNLTVRLKAEVNEDNPDEIVSTIYAGLVVNGKRQEIEPIMLAHFVSDRKAQRGEPVMVFEDSNHAYFIEYSLYKKTITAKLRSKYKSNAE